MDELDVYLGDFNSISSFRARSNTWPLNRQENLTSAYSTIDETPPELNLEDDELFEAGGDDCSTHDLIAHDPALDAILNGQNSGVDTTHLGLPVPGSSANSCVNSPEGQGQNNQMFINLNHQQHHLEIEHHHPHPSQHQHLLELQHQHQLSLEHQHRRYLPQQQQLNFHASANSVAAACSSQASSSSTSSPSTTTTTASHNLPPPQSSQLPPPHHHQFNHHQMHGNLHLHNPHLLSANQHLQSLSSSDQQLYHTTTAVGSTTSTQSTPGIIDPNSINNCASSQTHFDSDATAQDTKLSVSSQRQTQLSAAVLGNDNIYNNRDDVKFNDKNDANEMQHHMMMQKSSQQNIYNNNNLSVNEQLVNEDTDANNPAQLSRNASQNVQDGAQTQLQHCNDCKSDASNFNHPSSLSVSHQSHHRSQKNLSQGNSQKSLNLNGDGTTSLKSSPAKIVGHGASLTSLANAKSASVSTSSLSSATGVGINKKQNTPRRNAWGNMSYADLISQAINSTDDKRLTLSQIYDWMVQNVPYFKDKGDSNSSAGWKNSIRHNLSLHNRFKRMQNEGTGKSSWWVINPDAKFGKCARRRAASMETSKFEKKRGRAKKKADAIRNGLLPYPLTSGPIDISVLTGSRVSVGPGGLHGSLTSSLSGPLHRSPTSSSLGEGLDTFPESLSHMSSLSSLLGSSTSGAQLHHHHPSSQHTFSQPAPPPLPGIYQQQSWSQHPNLMHITGEFRQRAASNASSCRLSPIPILDPLDIHHSADQQVILPLSTNESVSWYASAGSTDQLVEGRGNSNMTDHCSDQLSEMASTHMILSNNRSSKSQSNPQQCAQQQSAQRQSAQQHQANQNQNSTTNTSQNNGSNGQQQQRYTASYSFDNGTTQSTTNSTDLAEPTNQHLISSPTDGNTQQQSSSYVRTLSNTGPRETFVSNNSEPYQQPYVNWW